MLMLMLMPVVPIFSMSCINSHSLQSDMLPMVQGGAAHSNRQQPALRALPGRSPRISAGPSSNASSPDRQPPRLPASAPPCSPVDGLGPPSSRLAQRIASMHQKFTAATNLMDADDDDSSDSTIAL